MSDDIPDSRWATFDDGWRAAADVVTDVDPDPTARRTVLHAVDDSDYPAALVFAAASVRQSDGRDAALRLAELLLPLIGLMLDEPDAREFESIAFDRDERLAILASVSRRLRSVVDAHQAGRAVPPDFRADVETWWDGLKAEGDVDAAIAKAKARLDAGRNIERFWLHEILLDWLYVDDQWRWQSALVLLAAGKVQRATSEMRSAADYAYNEKAPFADTFRRYADELEAATGTGAA